MQQQYEQTAQELARRIEALIPVCPHILDMTNPFDLFTLVGFECNDLQPSLAQAGAALAKRRYRDANPPTPAKGD